MNKKLLGLPTCPVVRYFRATNGTQGSEMWRASGDGSGATMMANLNTAGGSNPTNVSAFGDGVIFVADVTTSGVTSSKLVRANASSWLAGKSGRGTAARRIEPAPREACEICRIPGLLA